MQLIHCVCGVDAPTIPGAQRLSCSAVPTRKELFLIDELASLVLPEDPTPSLAGIQASPSVSYLGEPTFAPQTPSEPLRVVVSGSDAALGAVMTRLMRADLMWVEVAYLPVDAASPAARLWGLDSAVDCVDFAVEGGVVPAACVRNDLGHVVAGSASILGAGGGEIVGEIVVDSEQLVFRDSASQGRFSRLWGQFGAVLEPTMSAPGIRAKSLVGALRGSRELVGRAAQAGGQDLQVIVDGVVHPRPLSRSTFYRHLRDAQTVRRAQF